MSILKISSQPAQLEARFEEYGEGDSRAAGSRANFARELQLRPGAYTVLVNCSNAYGYAKPYLKITLAAGQTYEVACSVAGTSDNKARVGVTAIYTTGP